MSQHFSLLEIGLRSTIKLATSYILADAKRQDNTEYFRYNGIMRLESFSFEKFIRTLSAGGLFVDFDARTGEGRDGHNHGTKFRIRANLLPTLYEKMIPILNKPLTNAELSQPIDVSLITTVQQIPTTTGEATLITQMPLPKDET